MFQFTGNPARTGCNCIHDKLVSLWRNNSLSFQIKIRSGCRICLQLQQEQQNSFWEFMMEQLGGDSWWLWGETPVINTVIIGCLIMDAIIIKYVKTCYARVKGQRLESRWENETPEQQWTMNNLSPVSFVTKTMILWTRAQDTILNWPTIISLDCEMECEDADSSLLHPVTR